MAGVLTVVARIRAAKGKGDALAALLTDRPPWCARRARMRLVYRPHRSTTDPELFVFYEMYEDEAAFDAHRQAPHLAEYRQRPRKGRADRRAPSKSRCFAR
jgi:quinol monooxygenase YgiN